MELDPSDQSVYIDEIPALKSVPCWFGEPLGLPRSECYEIQVPEDHNHPEGRMISFPLVIFRADTRPKDSVPVFHLGAGGPGAPMKLDSLEQIQLILELYDDMSLNIGRDFYLIDPRGSGLSKPLLTCQTYVDNEVKRLTLNLSVVDEWTLIDRDYAECINHYKNQGVDFNFYNSEAIANDIEYIRQAIGIDQWVLVGVSYSTVYAQFVAKFFPETVQALVLDSPVFPNLKRHHHYVRKIMHKYDLLFRDCGTADKCQNPDEPQKLFHHFWNMHRYLNDYPMSIVVQHPYKNEKLPVTLNGQRFLAAILEGTYGTEIFTELKQILFDISIGDSRSIKPYLVGHLEFLLDETYGDITIDTHYCYEDKAFIDFELIRVLAEQLPRGYIRYVNKLAIDWPDHCDAMNIKPADATIAQVIRIDKPTLILQGELDSITPLSDVRAQEQYFNHLQVETFELSHDVLSSSDCAEKLAAYFIRNQQAGNRNSLCQ